MRNFILRFFLLFSFFISADIALADDPPKDNKNGENQNETPEQKLAAALKREEELKEQLEAEKKKNKTKNNNNTDDDDDENDLRVKARKETEKREKETKDTKQIERALAFNMQIEDFVVKNAAWLPADIPQLVKLANKENYDSAYLKAAAIKSAIIGSYFAVQANVDNLTPAQKQSLDAYLKLTKNARETNAADIFENIFEPSIEMHRRLKKAEEVSRSRSGYAPDNAGNAAYKDRLVKQAKKTHLGEKEA